MYRSGERQQREFGVRSGRYTGAALTIATKELPRASRELLSARLTDRGVSGAIASSGPPRESRRLAFGGLIAAILVVSLAADDGLGDASSANVMQPRWMAIVYFGALVAIALSVRSLVRTLSDEGWAPLPLGRHLLPLDLVDVRPGTITIRPFGEARDVRVDEAAHRVRIFYADSTLEELVATPQGRAKKEASLWVRVLDAQHALEEATHAGRAKDDPFDALRGEEGFTDSWRARAVAPAPLPKPPSRATLPIALAACATLGFFLVDARNAASDESMFAQARRAETATAYRKYLGAGGQRHEAEVRTALLPRAALGEATARGGIQPLRAFLRDYPSSGVEREARDRFDAACRAELADAGTLDALHAFEESAADCGLGAEIVSARLRLHDALLARAKARGIGPIREYLRRFPQGPLADRATAALRAAYEDTRNRVRLRVERAEVRDELLALVDRAETDARPVALFVPITLRPELWRESRSRREIVDAFDRQLADLFDPAVAFVYHPFGTAGLDGKGGPVLAIEIGNQPTLAPFARYTLGGAHNATWTFRFESRVSDAQLGVDVARLAIRSE
jgi:hypothetical protein